MPIIPSSSVRWPLSGPAWLRLKGRGQWAFACAVFCGLVAIGLLHNQACAQAPDPALEPALGQAPHAALTALAALDDAAEPTQATPLGPLEPLHAPSLIPEPVAEPVDMAQSTELPSTLADQSASQYGDSKIDSLRLMYTPNDGLYLYTTIDLVFSAAVKDALEQGIPAYFFAQTRVVQPRWWWFDNEASVQNRFWRLSYQPLTRKWRVQSSTISSEQTDQALGLAQSFDSLQAALVRIEHLNNWKIADARDLVAGADYDVEFTLGLDRSRVPRPLLISEGGRSFWDMQLKWRQRFSVPE